MNISNQGIEFIKKHEGLRLTAYRCTSNVLTIGYGHTGGVKAGQTITAAKAEEFLRSDLLAAETAVNTLVKVELSQHQYDALVSFTFNVGAGSLKRSMLLFVINEKSSNNTIECQFMRWVHSGGKVSKGLKSRRTEEVDLYINGNYGK